MVVITEAGRAALPGAVGVYPFRPKSFDALLAHCRGRSRTSRSIVVIMPGHLQGRARCLRRSPPAQSPTQSRTTRKAAVAVVSERAKVRCAEVVENVKLNVLMALYRRTTTPNGAEEGELGPSFGPGDRRSS